MVDWVLKSNYLYSDFGFIIVDFFFFFMSAASIWFCNYALTVITVSAVLKKYFNKYFTLQKSVMAVIIFMTDDYTLSWWIHTVIPVFLIISQTAKNYSLNVVVVLHRQSSIRLKRLWDSCSGQFRLYMFSCRVALTLQCWQLWCFMALLLHLENKHKRGVHRGMPNRYW